MKPQYILAALIISSSLSANIYAHGKKADDDGHADAAEVVKEQKPWGIAGAVSYTHLTLPTILLV